MSKSPSWVRIAVGLMVVATLVYFAAIYLAEYIMTGL